MRENVLRVFSVDDVGTGVDEPTRSNSERRSRLIGTWHNPAYPGDTE